MAFSRQQAKLDAIACKQRRARTMARGQEKNFKLKHSDWCRDAALGQYTLLNKKIKEDCEKAQAKVEKFQEKLHER